VDAGVSGTATSRPELDQCLESLNQGDILVVVRLDRLGRSAAHLALTVESLAKRGVGFRSLHEAIDTTTAAGRLILGIFGALAQFERDLIRERTVAALAAKKRRGEVLGRPRAMTPSQVAAAVKMLRDGEPPSHVSRVFRVDRSTLHRAVTRQKRMVDLGK
jgi:DNA invertase Pin-like site-specific DNA recombinase